MKYYRSDLISSNFRQIFGHLPKNTNREDIVDPANSTLDILKEQRARKAAARVLAPPVTIESDTESESSDSVTESESEIENPQPLEVQVAPPPSNPSQQSSHCLPPGLRRKDIMIANPSHAKTSGSSVPLLLANKPYRNPLGPTSGTGHLRQDVSSDPPQENNIQPEASQQPHTYQTQTVGKSHRHKKSKKTTN